MYQHFACKVIRPSSLIALLAMRYRGKDTSLPSVKDTLLSKSEGKGGVIKGSVGDPFDKYGKRIFLLKISFTLREKSVLCIACIIS